MYRLPLVLLLALSPAVAAADAQAGKPKAATCLLCHQPGFTAATLPTLQGQQAEYLRNQLTAYREQRRSGAIMQQIVSQLSDEDIRDIADYFGSRPPLKVSFGLDSAQVAAGKSAAEARGCAGCHQDDYAGNGAVPRLAGMDPAYTARQIEAFDSGSRTHPALATGSGVSAEEARNLAQYFAQIE